MYASKLSLVFSDMYYIYTLSIYEIVVGEVYPKLDQRF